MGSRTLSLGTTPELCFLSEEARFALSRLKQRFAGRHLCICSRDGEYFIVRRPEPHHDIFVDSKTPRVLIDTVRELISRGYVRYEALEMTPTARSFSAFVLTDKGRSEAAYLVAV